MPNTLVERRDLVLDAVQKCQERILPERAENRSIQFSTTTRAYTLVRLLDSQFRLLNRSTLVLHEDYDLSISLRLSGRTIYSNLSRIVVVLEDLFGESGEYYDPWKGAFSFPFLVRFQDGSEEYDYLMNILTIRTCLEFGLRKVMRTKDPDLKRHILHQPFPDFPKEEIQQFLFQFLLLLTEHFDAEKNRLLATKGFRTIASNLIVYGWGLDRDFFVECKSEEEYKKLVDTLEEIWK